MQLSKIKIAGFKSFVDPTTIQLPGKLVAVVGPNGCGKSNIIDAVTWVMGESSPKYLRGEALTDVIFNGATSRKPVGQASVELIFDNSDGTIGGEYGKYAEIAVKRVITRDSESTYYLNGVRCRKRDVVDIFLGTGLGPRSYSIIGQNMISRVIESKPDDMRSYLEEAAGISKYKERRHETELRIGHTKENLARVNDLRGELEKQLSNLKHQANVAEKYKSLKQQERVLRAELYGIQWRALDSRMVDYTLQIQREETALESRNAELTSTDRDIEQLRHEQRTAQDAFQEVQRRYYAVGNEITRVEQDILHHQEREQQWQNDLRQSETDCQSVKDQLSESEDQLRELDHDINHVEPQFASAGKEADILQSELSVVEDTLQSWQNRWDEFNQTASKTSQTSQVEKNHIQHVEQKINFLQKRTDQLNEDKHLYNFSQLNKEIEDFSKKSFEVADKLESQNKELADVRKEIQSLQDAMQDSSTNLDNLRSELQRFRGQQASLEALQQTALGQRDNPALPWIAEHQLGDKPRLAQHIEVDRGYEVAAEIVLGFCLQAICVDDVKDIVAKIEDFKSGNLCVFTQHQPSTNNSHPTKGTLLLQKIKSPWSLDSLLSGIYVADSMKEALALCETLATGESVVTRDGVWLNRSWIKLLREEDPAAGVFQREQELKELSTRIISMEKSQKELEEKIAEYKVKNQTLTQHRDQLQTLYSQQQAQSAQLSMQQKMKQERLTELKSQAERFLIEQEECTSQLKEAEAELERARVVLQQAGVELESHAKTRGELMTERDQVRLKLQQKRDAVNRQKEHIHELQIRYQTAKSQRSSVQNTLTRLHAQLAALSDRKVTLQSELASMSPIDTLKKSLARALEKHVNIEIELNSARAAMEALDQEFRNLDEKRQTLERDINRVRSVLESLRLEWQGWKVKSDSIIENMKDTEFTLESIMQQLTEHASPDEWQGKLDQCVQRINRLGPINLVAIDEYATCQERKQYLDKQVEDLQSGLNTLEEAIAKIDKETRQRFKETFDQVNTRFQELFPTIFGGGKAYLELTSDNLLESGVSVMACPPGKRNSSIYLLSGGEKSLTAIALVFSIFYLNPAPFCLLDEVDAALDDANVLRFTRLVKSMTEKTQFIFISHNKITIEMGEYLIGVTMNEPGVSRLVSVDMEKAISLAGA